MLIELGYAHRAEWIHSTAVTGLASTAVVLPILARFLPVFRSRATRERAAKVLMLAAGVAVPVLAVVCFYFLRGWAEWPESAPIVS